LRELSEPRVFDYFDYVTLDDGERPLLVLLEHLQGDGRRTGWYHFRAHPGCVRYIAPAIPTMATFLREVAPRPGTAASTATCRCWTCSNPMHRLWSDGHWNKLTVAHAVTGRMQLLRRVVDTSAL